MEFQVIKYNGRWCIFSKTSKTYFFVAKGKKANVKKCYELNNGI